MECKSCGAQIADDSTQCTYCQAAVSRAPAPAPTVPATSPTPAASSPPNKLAAGLCGIFLGALGVHKFILGYHKAGAIMLAITLLTCGYGGLIVGVIGMIEGILYLTKSDEVFVQTYVTNTKEWF